MATLYEEFTLCGLVASAGAGVGQGILGLEPGPDSDRVLLTDRGRTATLYQVSDQKPLGCWSVKQDQTITCPAVCNFETGEYIAVHDDKVLRIWKDEDMNLDKVFKATLTAEVYRIHSLPDTEPLVLFKRGAVRTLDALLAAPQQEIENVISDEDIRWSDAFMETQQPVLIFITEKNGNYFVYVQKVNPNILHKYKLELEESFHPLCFTTYTKNKILTLLCLYSNGCVYKILVSLQQSVQEEQQILSKSLLLKIVESGTVLKGASLAVLDKDHVAVLGCLDSPPTIAKACLSIWNTKFQTLQTSKELPQGTSGQLWCYGEKFFLTHGKVLTVILYKCEMSSLAAAVGKLKDTQTSSMRTVFSSVNWNMLHEEHLTSPHTEQPVIAKNESKRNLRSRRSNVAKVQPQTLTVEQLLSDIKDSSQKDIEEELRQFLLNAQMSDFQATVGYVITGLVNRCKTEPTFYPRNSLVQLIQTQGLSYSLCPDLMTVALEKTDVHLLQLCLQQFPDIPEAVTCVCLKAFLSINDDSLEGTNVNLDSVINYINITPNEQVKKQTETLQNGFSSELMEEDGCDIQLTQKPCAKETEELCPVGPQKAALLNAILRSAYSETFLLPHLKDLSAQQVILFLRYLQFLYVKYSEKFSTDLPGMFSPTINQIMDWMCLVLDAHFTVVVMLPEAKGLLCSLHKFVRAQVRFYSELNKIEGSLQELQRLKHQKDFGLYSIEMLELV
uniref:Nucleolar protein 11 n=1 Tax=Pelodiscus sinensis TaxID=13735 RepID=K7FIU4_PELSI|nr:nucleolar protein 11 isoform X1 [Pelodiscus sinensis]|eukprot:XP_006110651.1 nucleolar protein 11 isoform X1 [Pelodiscus sinensis]